MDMDRTLPYVQRDLNLIIETFFFSNTYYSSHAERRTECRFIDAVRYRWHRWRHRGRPAVRLHRNVRHDLHGDACVGRSFGKWHLWLGMAIRTKIGFNFLVAALSTMGCPLVIVQHLSAVCGRSAGERAVRSYHYFC